MSRREGISPGLLGIIYNMPLNLLLLICLAYEFISYNQAKAITSEAILGTAACFSRAELEGALSGVFPGGILVVA